MVLESLMRGSAMASCSNEMIVRTSQRPRNFSLQRRHCCIAASSKASHREPVYSIMPLRNAKRSINQINVNSCRKSHFSENWIEDSISDIVKHINEAPFLQLLFDAEDRSTTITSQRQRVPAGNFMSADEKWDAMKSEVSSASPDGVILVHHLQDNSNEGPVVEDKVGIDASQRDSNDNVINRSRDGKDFWGILVVGRAIAKNACYILETTNVASPFGACTSFCLTKAQSFGASWQDQIRSSWLSKKEI